jgi:beta-xylosidase
MAIVASTVIASSAAEAADRTVVAAPDAMAVKGTPVAGPKVMQLPEMPLHDPFILADPGKRTYYLYTSNIPRLTGQCGLGTMAYASHDLKTWSTPKLVFRLPAGTWANGGAWAPEVHLWKGHYYLFTTFHNESLRIPGPAKAHRSPYRRGTVLARADSPDGPFTLMNKGEPIAGSERMTLDGTLYVDPHGKPWLVYAHEWLQQTDGTMEALALDDDLKAVGKPVVLFKASDAGWVKGSRKGVGDTVYVTDGPELFRTRDGHLLMLWSSYDEHGYVQSVARSSSGNIQGPWTQLAPLVRADSGHGMLFRRFDGQLMLVLHRPFNNARGKLYEMRDAGDHLEVVDERTDLDGDAGTATVKQSPSAFVRRVDCSAK